MAVWGRTALHNYIEQKQSVKQNTVLRRKKESYLSILRNGPWIWIDILFCNIHAVVLWMSCTFFLACRPLLYQLPYSCNLLPFWWFLWFVLFCLLFDNKNIQWQKLNRTKVFPNYWRMAKNDKSFKNRKLNKEMRKHSPDTCI